MRISKIIIIIIILLFLNQSILQAEELFLNQNVLKDKDVVSDAILIQCESMKKDKESLVASAGKKILAGAAIGAAVGAAAAGKKRREEGAILGAIAGMIAATGYELWTKKDLFEEDALKVARKVGYQPSQGPYLKIREIKLNKENFKIGESLRLILRVDYLFPEAVDSEKLNKSKNFAILNFGFKENKEETSSIFHEITIKAYYLKDNQEYYVAEETYNIPPGSTPFLYVFPICEAFKKGEHTIKFVIEKGNMKDEKIVIFNRI